MSIPSSWVDRIFLRMTAVYGAQKMATMWADVPIEERRVVWGDALGKYSANAIALAIRDLPETASGWPPTLPEFVALVKVAREESARNQPLALPDDSQIVSPETARERLAEIMTKMKRVPS